MGRPLLHALNAYALPFWHCCAEVMPSCIWYPITWSTVYGVITGRPSTSTSMPGGVLVTTTSTFSGKICTLLLAERPSASVTVSVMV
jgi:hypothetical protein